MEYSTECIVEPCHKLWPFEYDMGYSMIRAMRHTYDTLPLKYSMGYAMGHTMVKYHEGPNALHMIVLTVGNTMGCSMTSSIVYDIPLGNTMGSIIGCTMVRAMEHHIGRMHHGIRIKNTV